MLILYFNLNVKISSTIFTWKQRSQLWKVFLFACGPPKWVVTSCLCSKWIRRLTPIHIIHLTVTTHPSLSTWFLDSSRPPRTRPLTIVLRRPPRPLQSTPRLHPFTSRPTVITVLLPILQLRFNINKVNSNNNNCRHLLQLRQPQVIKLCYVFFTKILKKLREIGILKSVLSQRILNQSIWRDF